MKKILEVRVVGLVPGLDPSAGPTVEALVVREGGTYYALPALTRDEEGDLRRVDAALDDMNITGGGRGTTDRAACVAQAQAWADERRASLVGLLATDWFSTPLRRDEPIDVPSHPRH